ncbi:hypothetical protein K7432_004691 [Basidiobolus ranarum]|uniref:Uncharacterized protein n=1 Tax=Basidiobolus ranarum TaxID=34480 RepID=A0ABR2WXY8_9FUNG
MVVPEESTVVLRAMSRKIKKYKERINEEDIKNGYSVLKSGNEEHQASINVKDKTKNQAAYRRDRNFIKLKVSKAGGLLT